MSFDLTFDAYQDSALSTLVAKAPDLRSYVLISLAGEVGELLNHWKKHLRSGDEYLDPALEVKMKDEMGDALWYLAILAYMLDEPLSHIAERNLTKLAARVQAGTLAAKNERSEQ